MAEQPGVEAIPTEVVVPLTELADPTADDVVAACATLRKLTEDVRRHTAALKQFETLKRELSLALALAFRKLGMQSTKIDGRTFALRTDLILRKKDASVTQDEICDALEADEDWKEYSVRQFATNPLKAYVRELLDAAKPGTDPLSVLPESIRGLFHADRIPSVRCTKS